MANAIAPGGPVPRRLRFPRAASSLRRLASPTVPAQGRERHAPVDSRRLLPCEMENDRPPSANPMGDGALRCSECGSVVVAPTGVEPVARGLGNLLGPLAILRHR